MEPPRQRKPHAWLRASKKFHARTAAQLDPRWLSKFAELLTYRQARGTFAAPRESDLGAWVQLQRRRHAANRLPAAARAKLAGCGFFEPFLAPAAVDAARPPTSGTALRAEQRALLGAVPSSFDRPGTAVDEAARPRIASRPSFERPGTASATEARPRVTSWGDDVVDLSPRAEPSHLDGVDAAWRRSDEDAAPKARRPKSVRFADRVTGAEAHEHVRQAAARGCAWCGRADGVTGVCGVRLCAACRRAKTPAAPTTQVVRRSRDAPAVPSDAFPGLALRPLATVTRAAAAAPPLLRIETPSEIRTRRGRQRRRRVAAEELTRADRDARAADAAALQYQRRCGTPPTVAAMLDTANDSVTLTALRTHVAPARPDLFEWLTRGHLPVEHGVVPVAGLERAVAVYEAGQRRENINGEADRALDVALGIVEAPRPRSGWHRDSMGFVPGRHASWTPKTPSRPEYVNNC